MRARLRWRCRRLQALVPQNCRMRDHRSTFNLNIAFPGGLASRPQRHRLRHQLATIVSLSRSQIKRGAQPILVTPRPRNTTASRMADLPTSAQASRIVDAILFIIAGPLHFQCTRFKSFHHRPTSITASQVTATESSAQQHVNVVIDTDINIDAEPGSSFTHKRHLHVVFGVIYPSARR